MKKTRRIRFVSALLASVHMAGSGYAAAAPADVPPPQPVLAAASAPVAAPVVLKIKPYRLDTCVVTGEALGSMGAPVVMIYGQQEVKFCCSSCPEDFAKDPAKYLKPMIESEKKLPAPKETPVQPYTLKNCLVMNKEIGSMGAPIVIHYNGREVDLCCKDCLPAFNRDPQGLLRRIVSATAAESAK